MSNKPPCYTCVHRLNIPGDCHSRCNNFGAKVTAHETGIRRGWFNWPFNFDPAWLQSCDGFSDKGEDIKPRVEADPITELLMMLK